MENTLKILESVNQFYSQSFSQLIVITVSVLAFAGIIMPIFISMYQKKIFNLDHKLIESNLNSKINKLIKVKSEELNNEIESLHKLYDDKIDKLEESFNKKMHANMGSILHVQGFSYKSEKAYGNALDSFIKAAVHYIKSDNESNLRRVIDHINLCLAQLNSKDFDIFDNIPNDFDNLIEDLNKYNENDRYRDDIQSMKRNMKAAIKREA
jgi:hypothetical protein